MVWLNEYLRPKARMWAYRYTAECFTAGAHSTQRGESCNAALKQCLKISKFNLTDLQNYLDANCTDMKLNAEIENERHIKSIINSSKAHGPILEFLESKISPYAFKKAQEQYAQKDFYGFEEIRVDGNLLGWRVYRMNTNVITDIDLVLDGENYGSINSELGLDSSLSPIDRIVDVSGLCSCRLLNITGITCRHFFCVLDTLIKTHNPLANEFFQKCMNNFWSFTQEPSRCSGSVLSLSQQSKSLNANESYNHDSLQGYCNYILEACKQDSSLAKVSGQRLKALSLDLRNMKFKKNPSSSELIGVGNMPVQSSSNHAGRKPGSKNNSTVTGTVTVDSNFASLTNAELIQVLKWNSRTYSGKNKDALLDAVRSIPKENFQALVINNSMNNAIHPPTLDKQRLDTPPRSDNRNSSTSKSNSSSSSSSSISSTISYDIAGSSSGHSKTLKRASTPDLLGHKNSADAIRHKQYRPG